MSTRTKRPRSSSKPPHTFQVNLGGIIELLSHHLYSGPHVYLRELLQNAVDAIEARRQLGDSTAGEVTIELVPDSGKGAGTLIFEDNGIGLTEEEVHQFLATIGSSSKRGALSDQRGDFIGQFGIGLLSAFMVSDEIVMITRSAKKGAPVLEWRGRSDGTYALRTLPTSEAKPGTKVFLKGKPSAADQLQPEYVLHHLQNFGAFLPHQIEFVHKNARQTITLGRAPWEDTRTGAGSWRQECLEYGDKVFGIKFLDCFPLSVPAAGIRGIAYVLPSSPSLAARRSDRVYLKRMLLAEQVDGLLPEWAFFVRCVINSTALNPNASREAFQQDEVFEKARVGLAECLRAYLVELARSNQERLQQIIGLHYRSIKVLAADDEEFYRLFIDWLPFETCQGQLSMGTIRANNQEILYVGDIDSFRQIAPVAAAQSMCLINAGYTCDVELIARLSDTFENVTVRRIEANELLDELEEVPLEVQEAVAPAMDLVSEILGRFNCNVELRSFRPAELPALYSLSTEARFLRDVQRTREVANDLWQGVLSGVTHGSEHDSRGSLCLNWRNPLVKQLLALERREVLKRPVELLYVQALLQGHFPLGAAEYKALSEGLTSFLELATRPTS